MMKCKKIVFGIIAPWAVAIVALPSVVGGRNADAIYFDDEDADDKDSSTHDLAKVLSQMEKDQAGRDGINDTKDLLLKDIHAPDDGMDLLERKDGEIFQVSRRLSSSPYCAAGEYKTGAPSVYQGDVDLTSEETTCTSSVLNLNDLRITQDLDGLNVNCATGGNAIGFWKVIRGSSNCEDARPYNIEYGCLSISNFRNGVDTINRNTAWLNARGWLHQGLSRHYVDCPYGYVLQQFELDKGTGDQAKIDYKCAHVGETTCVTKYSYRPVMVLHLYDLASIPISCPSSKPFVQSWKYDSSNTRFEFTCCSIPVCEDCGTGEYSNQGDNDCSRCEPGTYNDLTGQARCEACPTGAFSHEGASSCTDCPEGEYQEVIGQQSCKPCEASYYQDDNGQVSCKRCAPGMWSNEGAADCMFCPGGTYSNTAAIGLAGCKQCQAGTYSTDVDPASTDGQANSACQDCPNGSWSPAGSTECVICPDGATIKVDQSGCNDIDECKDDSKHGCPKDSFCKNIVKDETSDGASAGYLCHCNPGFAVKGSEGVEVSGNNEIVCEARPIQLEVNSSNYKTIFGLKIAHSTIERDAGFVGCYDVTADDGWQAVARTAGESCVDVCFDYKYAAESSSSFCFCSNSFPETIQEATSSNECDKASVYANGAETFVSSFDLHVKEYTSKTNVRAIVGSPFEAKGLHQFEVNGHTINDLIPGTEYLLELTPEGDTSTVASTKYKTTCECETTDAPKSLQITQEKGLVTLIFTDESRCEDGYSFSRNSISGEVDIFAPTYYYVGDKACYDVLMPGEQFADNLFRTRLNVGEVQDYCVQPVGSRNGMQYAGEITCKKHQITWEASIKGIVTLPKHAGSLPVEGATMSWQLMSTEGSVIESNKYTTGPSGKFLIEFNSNDSDLFTSPDGTNRDVEVRIQYSKSTNGNVHEFMCQDGEIKCSGDYYTSVFLNHLDFNIEHTAFDISTALISGRVIIDGTGNTPIESCPIIGAEVCSEVQGAQESLGEKTCVETKADGSFEVGAPIGTTVKLKVNYHSHKFRLDQEDYQSENDDKGFLITENGSYEGFIFNDEQKAELETQVFGGLCRRHLGNATLTISLPSCPDWVGLQLSQSEIQPPAQTNPLTGFSGNFHFVLAHFVKVEVDIDGRYDIEIPEQYVDLREVRPEEGNKYIEGSEHEEDSSQMDLKMLAFQYDGKPKVTVGALPSLTPESCRMNSDDETFLVLPAYKDFTLIVMVEQDFGKEIERCDHLPDHTTVTIESYVGLIADDKAFKEKVGEEALVEYTRCSSASDGCVLSVEHTEDEDGTVLDAHVMQKLRAGPPRITGDYTKSILISVNNEPLNTVNVLITGDYDDGIPTTYHLPGEPVMILRDPPGDASYAFYENVRTTTRIQIEGMEKYEGSKAEHKTGAVAGTDTGICLGFAAFLCTKALKINAGTGVVGENSHNEETYMNEDTNEAKFVTTWSYQTSDENASLDPQGHQQAGHQADIFVVPTIALKIIDVIEISLNSDQCKGASTKKTKFDAALGEENALAFLSKDKLDAQIQSLETTKATLEQEKKNYAEGSSDWSLRQEASGHMTEALNQWATIISHYESVNEFTEESNLINPVDWFETNKDECPESIDWGETAACQFGFEEHWTSLLPAGLSENQEDYNDFKDVHLISFSGGGASLDYWLDKSYSKELAKLLEGSRNDEESDFLGGWWEFCLTIKNIGPKTEGQAGDLTTTIRTGFEHDLSGVDTGVGFVLSDYDVGDFFDVKVGIDPKYGSFVFKTVGGMSKCPYEPNTKQREEPFLMLTERPEREILPDKFAVFKVELGNNGETATTLDLSMERRDNVGGLAVYANGGTLAVNQNYENINPQQSFETTISIKRGPVLYEYPPIELRFESTCDPSIAATLDLYTHVLTGGQKVIRFARECPSVGWVGDGFGFGRVVVNATRAKDTENMIPMLIQNLERNERGKFLNMSQNADDTFDTVEVVFREAGSEKAWNVVPMNLLQDFDEDEYGFIAAKWDFVANDGEYDVMLRSRCPSAHEEFKIATSKIALLKVDRMPPEPYSFPSESLQRHVGDPIIFEYNEELDCTRPFNFQVEMKVLDLVDGNEIVIKRLDSYRRSNLIAVCEGRMIGIQVDESRYDLDLLAGKKIKIILNNIADTSGNIANRKVSYVHFMSAGGGGRALSSRRKLSDVPSIKEFQDSPPVTKTWMTEGEGKISFDLLSFLILQENLDKNDLQEVLYVLEETLGKNKEKLEEKLDGKLEEKLGLLLEEKLEEKLGKNEEKLGLLLEQSLQEKLGKNDDESLQEKFETLQESLYILIKLALVLLTMAVFVILSFLVNRIC